MSMDKRGTYLRTGFALVGGFLIGVGIARISRGLANHQNFVNYFSGYELGLGLGLVFAARELRYRRNPE